MAPFEVLISKWERQTRKPITTVSHAQEVPVQGHIGSYLRTEEENPTVVGEAG